MSSLDVRNKISKEEIDRLNGYSLAVEDSSGDGRLSPSLQRLTLPN